MIVDLLDILAKPARVTTIIRDELDGDPRPVRRQARRSEIVAQGVDLSHRGPDRAGGHGRHAVARRLHEGAAGRPNTARSGAAGAASRRRRRRRTTSSTGCSSPTRTISSCASPTAAASTGSRSTTCRRAARSSRGKPIVNLRAAASTTRRSRRSCRSKEFTEDQLRVHGDRRWAR